MKEQNAKTEKIEDDYTKELDEQHVTIMNQTMGEGRLTRRKLLSDEYYNNQKPWISKHLHSRPWKEHKARRMDWFGHMVEGFDCNVTGEGNITPFEKHNTCSMIAWKGCQQPLFAAIRNLTQS